MPRTRGLATLVFICLEDVPSCARPRRRKPAAKLRPRKQPPAARHEPPPREPPPRDWSWHPSPPPKTFAAPAQADTRPGFDDRPPPGGGPGTSKTPPVPPTVPPPCAVPTFFTLLALLVDSPCLEHLSCSSAVMCHLLRAAPQRPLCPIRRSIAATTAVILAAPLRSREQLIACAARELF